MAQDLNFEKFIDVDNTVIKPSLQRVRNILTLEEKIAVIQAYEQRPMYKKVARMFNCSWEQIKNIITNRAAIMEYYHATKNKSLLENNVDDGVQLDLKQRKIKFLGECVYECIKRLQYHAKMPITEELIRHKALEFLDILRIPGFFPTKKWINLFKATYNITLSNKQISIYTEPQSSFDIKDIMTYCTKSRTSKSLVTKYKKHEVKNVEYEAKRMRKLIFLQDALKEYLLRVKFHHKSIKLNTDELHAVAQNFNEILKVQDFEPTTEWIECFRKQHDSGESLANSKRPPLSLDLKDILSYCSRMQNKTKANTITLTPKETALQMRVMPKHTVNTYCETGLKFQQNNIIYLDDGAGQKDIKLNIKQLNAARPSVEQPPPLKIRKIESINNDPELQCKNIDNTEKHKTPIVAIRQLAKEPPKEDKPVSKTIIYIQKMPNSLPKENVSYLTPQPQVGSVEVKREGLDDNNYILPTIASPQLGIHHVYKPSSSSTLSPGYHHSSPTNSSDDHDAEELPRHVKSFKDVLLLLKPLEEYAMLKENYRAIGLITQLEKVLKNDPETSMANEEFIG